MAEQKENTTAHNVSVVQKIEWTSQSSVTDVIQVRTAPIRDTVREQVIVALERGKEATNRKE